MKQLEKQKILNKELRSIYPKVPGIHRDDFHLPPGGLTPEQRLKTLKHLQKYMATQKTHFLGYQLNQAFDYQEDFGQYLNYHINNIGDPFQGSNFKINSKCMERAVLDYYADLWHAKRPHDPKDPDSYWGYVLTMGCSEGNFYGLWN